MEFTKKEIDFIKKQKVLRLATTDKNVKPHVVPVWFVLDNNNIYIHSDVSLKKNKNMKENPLVSVVWDEVTGRNGGGHGVMIQGIAKRLPNDKEYDTVRQLFYKRYPVYYNDENNRFGYEEVDIFRIDIEKKISWGIK